MQKMSRGYANGMPLRIKGKRVAGDLRAPTTLVTDGRSEIEGYPI